MKRNEDRLKELGLFKAKDVLAANAKKTKTKKIPQVSPQLPQRRSSRKRKTTNYGYEQVIPMYEDDSLRAREESDGSDDSESSDSEDVADYEASDDDEIENDEVVEEDPPKKRSKFTSTKPKQTAIVTSFDCVNPNGGLTLEYAKTGRSTCRKCKNKIEKGKPRVGMEAWIVGRNCITWQCPGCLLQNLCCAYEKSKVGKGKCKVSQAPFVKGQLKVGIRCHTATSYYCTEAIAGVLSNVVCFMRTDGSDKVELTVDGMDGNDKLSNEDRQKLKFLIEEMLQTTGPQLGNAIPEVTKSLDCIEEKANKQNLTTNPKEEKMSALDKKQTNARTKGVKGKVQWKFGGHICYGTLISRMETKTHCYARTKKGNVKTLAKGKDYWSVTG